MPVAHSKINLVPTSVSELPDKLVSVLATELLVDGTCNFQAHYCCGMSNLRIIATF
jgi:hypothetical protein